MEQSYADLLTKYNTLTKHHASLKEVLRNYERRIVQLNDILDNLNRVIPVLIEENQTAKTLQTTIAELELELWHEKHGTSPSTSNSKRTRKQKTT